MHKHTSLYVASKGKHGEMWQTYRARGVPITAQWIDVFEEGAIADLVAHWDMCIADVLAAEAFVLFAQEGEIQKGSLVEMGAALAAGKPVYYVGPPDLLSALHHRNVQRFESLDKLFARLGYI